MQTPAQKIKITAERTSTFMVIALLIMVLKEEIIYPAVFMPTTKQHLSCGVIK
jgi:hypothetical protein